MDHERLSDQIAQTCANLFTNLWHPYEHPRFECADAISLRRPARKPVEAFMKAYGFVLTDDNNLRSPFRKPVETIAKTYVFEQS